MKAKGALSKLMIGVILLAGVAPLTSCTSNESDSVTSAPQVKWTLETAKAVVLSTENRIVATFPAHFVARADQLSASPLLACDIKGRHGYIWPGHTAVALTGQPVKGELVQRLRDTWKSQNGYSVKVAESPDDVGYVMKISGPSETSYFISFSRHDTEVSIDSFSPCFALPDGDNGGDY